VKKDFQRDDAASREHHPNTEELWWDEAGTRKEQGQR
jgi:hypothetical protein